MNIIIGTVVLMALAGWVWRLLDTQARRQQAVERVGQMVLTNSPRMMIALVSAGLFAELLPDDLVRQYLGETSGVAGILLGAALGVCTPGGAFVAFALAAGAMNAGAAAPVLVAYVSAWSLFALTKVITEEMVFLGPRFILARVTVSFPLPVLAGLVAWAL